MKLFLALSILSASFGAYADSLLFTCTPGASPNGLGIQKLILDISTDDPDATMTLSYERSTRPVVSNMAYTYEGDPSHYALIPDSKRDGEISVHLLKKNGNWIANVKSESIDTFSVLDCK